MALELRWVNESEADRVAETRMLCYSPAGKDIEKYRDGIRNDPRNMGDYLLAELDGEAVGTCTSVPLQMWARGHRVSCQGVAYVGTIKTHRRGGGGEKGIASRLMWETIRLRREQEQVVTALMPFRASYYEHFGYGVVERRTEWTLPLNVIPSGDFSGVRFYKPADLNAMTACRQRVAQAGQCDIERSEKVWGFYVKKAADGFLVVDRPTSDGPVHGYMTLMHEQLDGKDRVRVTDWAWETPAALVKHMHFLGSLRDQYSAALFITQSDVPVNWLTKETQIPHRLVNHPVPAGRPFTRMQVRILDHKRFVEGMKLPKDVRGGAIVAVRESEGHVSKFRLDVEGGRVALKTSEATADLECSDRVWAAIVTGDMPAGRAVEYGLASGKAQAAELLEAFARGPAPFTYEYF